MNASVSAYDYQSHYHTANSANFIFSYFTVYLISYFLSPTSYLLGWPRRRTYLILQIIRSCRACTYSSRADVARMRHFIAISPRSGGGIYCHSNSPYCVSLTALTYAHLHNSLYSTTHQFSNAHTS